MMYLPLPTNHPRTGPCKINGRPAEYRVYPDRVEYRHHLAEGWTRCAIIAVEKADDRVFYVCASGGAA